MIPVTYLICGVPGSGKTWVCEQLSDQYNYVAHDIYPTHKALSRAAYQFSQDDHRPVLIDCPFAERDLKKALEKRGFKVIPLFIIEEPSTVKTRYQKREGKDPAPNVMTRAETIADRAQEWDALSGTSEEILTYLKNL